MVSVEGLDLPIKPLSNFVLEDAVRKLRIWLFRGAYLRDTLPKAPRDNECGIINLHNSNGNGNHWVTWIKRNNTKIYFDSYGLSPPQDIVKYLGKPLYYSIDPVPKNGVICGALCLFVLRRLNEVGERELLPNFQNTINDLLQLRLENVG